MATLTQFRSEMAAVLGLDVDSADELEMIDFYVNEGVKDVLHRTHCHVLPFEIAMTGPEDDFTLPAAMLAVLELNYGTSTGTFPLTRTTHAEILRRRQASPASTAPSRLYALVGANMIMFYPTPSEEDTISGIYVPVPATLTFASDTPDEIPSEWHKAVSFYALARGADMDDDSTSEQGERYRGLYEGAIQELRRAVYRHGGSRMSPARVTRRRARLVPHDNSADY